VSELAAVADPPVPPKTLVDISDFLLARCDDEVAEACCEDESCSDACECDDHRCQFTHLLRGIDAKRLAIAEHAKTAECAWRRCKVCVSHDPWDGFSWVNYPCRTLRVLAAADADHPDYDEEAWRP
jgi:hypothetical protein